MVLPDQFTPGFWMMTAAALLAAAVASLWRARGLRDWLTAMTRLTPPAANDNDAVFATPRSRIFEV
jgi:hypothetical protein